MAAPIDASMPQGLDIDGGYVLRVTALDPVTGNQVANVSVGAMEIVAYDLRDDAGAGPDVPLPPALLGYNPGTN